MLPPFHVKPVITINIFMPVAGILEKAINELGAASLSIWVVEEGVPSPRTWPEEARNRRAVGHFPLRW